METKLEVATIKANTPPLGGLELYWLLSRNQLEFILQDITITQSSLQVATAQYQEAMLPVINLEKHFGLPETGLRRSPKYLVIRAATAEKSLVKVIIETPQAVKMQHLEMGRDASRLLALPRNNSDLLGVYAMSDGSLGIVPDIAGISGSLQWRGGQQSSSEVRR
ncbi:MAG: chemotaxis protein CheW [Proteobacteria bacterium]|nr:chemotaxis protein CheW [Pseudomonadota bacterium]